MQQNYTKLVHPFCNLTTNEPITYGKQNYETFYYYLPTTWLVFRILFLFLFGGTTLLTLKESIVYVKYQRNKQKKWKEMLCIFHFQLLKLLILFTASLIRFIWFLQPYYVEASTTRLFGQTLEAHSSVADTLLRYAQVSMFIVLLLQIKSWRQTVRNTRKLKRTNSRNALAKNSRRTVARAADPNVMLEIKIDTIVVTSAIVALIFSAVLNSLFPSIQVFFLHKLIVALQDDKASKKSSKKQKATTKINRIRRCICSLILSAIVLIFASVFRSTIKLCKKDEYKIESIKYLIFVLMIHLLCEFNIIVSLYFTLYSKREPHKKPAESINNYQSSTYDDRSDVFTDVEVVTSVNPMMQHNEENMSKVKQLGY